MPLARELWLTNPTDASRMSQPALVLIGKEADWRVDGDDLRAAIAKKDKNLLVS
jgi:hypothetical protein